MRISIHGTVSDSISISQQPELISDLVSDDTDTKTETVMIFGTALLSALSVLAEHCLLTKDSPVRNIGLIISLFIRFGHNWENCGQGIGETGWMLVAVKIADKYGIELKESIGIEEKIEELRDELDNDDDEDGDNTCPDNLDDDFENGVRRWKIWDWDIEVRIPSTQS